MTRAPWSSGAFGHTCGIAGDMDTLIAAIALSYSEPVLTRNPAHFSNMPGVKVLSYG
jgi:predicted nucleic acid-binding protein